MATAWLMLAICFPWTLSIGRIPIRMGGRQHGAFPRDSAESSDRDGDGVGDNADVFPDDPTETVDTDHDGVGNNSDALPFDTRDWQDTDGDGVGDNVDEDADNDGIADAFDLYPLDATRSDASSYQFNLVDGSGIELSFSAAGDVDSDGRADFLIGQAGYNFDKREWTSGAYLIAAADLQTADAADGTADRIVDADQLAIQPGSWKFVGENKHGYAGSAVALAGDVDGDGTPELIIGASQEPGQVPWGLREPPTLLPSRTCLRQTRRTAMPMVSFNLGNIASQANSWKLVGEIQGGRAGASVRGLGDINRDGLADFVVGAPITRGA